MGHFKTKWQAAPIIPRDLKLAVRMVRDVPSVVAGDCPTPPCVAIWRGWEITTPDSLDLDEPFDIGLAPNEASTLCDGDCLEWAMIIDGYEGDPPNITLVPDEDCRSVVIHGDDDRENLIGITITVAATLDGNQFGCPYALRFEDPICDPECAGWEYPFGTTYPNLAMGDSAVLRVQMQGDSCVCEDLLDTIVLTPSGSGGMGFGSFEYVGDCTWDLTITNPEGNDLSGGFVQIDATVDRGLGAEPICGPANFTCEE